MSRWSRNSSERRGPPVELTGPVALSEADERAIFAVLDQAVYAAGRTSVMMALRGSRAEKVKRLGLVDLPGHGHFAGIPEAEVMAKIDTFFHRGWLRFERTREGLPLVAYTEPGLERAKAYVVERWLEEVRAQVGPVARGEALQLSFLMAANPQRNHDTVLLLVDRVEREADAMWPTGAPGVVRGGDKAFARPTAASDRGVGRGGGLRGACWRSKNTGPGIVNQ